MPIISNIEATIALVGEDGAIAIDVTPDVANSAQIRLTANRTNGLSLTATTSLRYQMYVIDCGDRFPLQEGGFVVKPSVGEYGA